MKALGELIKDRLSRRVVLGGLAASAATPVLAGLTGRNGQTASAAELRFKDLPQVIADGDAVVDGYDIQRVISWGDPMITGAPDFNSTALRADTQAVQFGFNNDFMAYLPLPKGSLNSAHGLLAVNHEYTNPELMFANYRSREQTADQTAVEMAAHGLSVVEVKFENGRWSAVGNSSYNRRITANTAIAIAGPAAGHHRMKTKSDPEGKTVLGTLGNCSGGTTPWGTVLTCEENIHFYFGGGEPSDPSSYGMGISEKGNKPWHKHQPRFNPSQEPNESNRFGWVVEYDPYDPKSRPAKRTALGRFKHESATTVIAPDGRLVVYMGDDEPFQFLYRYVSKRKVGSGNGANRDLLDEGTLFVARFEDDGKLVWLALAYGAGPLTAANGFASEADMLIDTRRAAAALGATPMDRPEDIETNPSNGRVYAVLTNNTQRSKELAPANPRAKNPHGHILELTPPARQDGKLDHTADKYTWDAFLLAGKPDEDGGHYGEGTQVWLSSPDNIAFDPKGRLWIASDQGKEQASNAIPDGMFVCDTDGPHRAKLKFFYAVPRGAECCGPTFTPDGKTLFIAVQHPGETSTFDKPSTRWPDFKDNVPPRPTVVAIVKKDGGPIAG